ncbi:hypothetical protein F25303_14315 [Fusarium sp. NRRL 25303]|nr:hypothetical protein F25303_14315 [Fusarium sp. NRRL 25303]
MNGNTSTLGRSSLMSQLGRVSTTVLASLFVVCLGCLTFLAFLWGANENNSVWRTIVLAGWTARSITITSLVLRWATAAQAAICTSMLAAILLQNGAIPLPVAASVSIMRFNNTGPWSLLGTMKAKWHRGSVSIGLLTALLVFTTLSLQFTSTVLLSQVGIASIPVASLIPQTHYNIETNGYTYNAMPSDAPSFLDLTPSRYPAFAEWSPDATTPQTTAQQKAFPPENSTGILDTGSVLRALLPINNDEERSRVTEYHRFATVLDTRVVCMRPKLTNVEFTMDDGYQVLGLANINKTPAGLIQQEDLGSKNFSISFKCNFAASAGGNYSEPDWSLALCHGSQEHSFQGISSFMQSRREKETGDSYLIVNATLVEAVGDLDDSDVWESVTRLDSSGIVSVRLQITLCMTAFQAQRMIVNATRSTSIPPEPSLIWDASKTSWNTEAVLQQLGALRPNSTTVERGIFDLSPSSWRWKTPPDGFSLSGEYFETADALYSVGWDPLYEGMVNSAQFSILKDTVMSTKNPALALQAYLTRLCFICYYDRIAMFDAIGPSLQVSLTQVTRPLGWTAFIIVAVVTLLHLVLILSVTLKFRRAGSLSLIQNTWAAISQLLGPMTEDWIRDADTVDDKTVKSWLKDRGLHEKLVGIEHIESRLKIEPEDDLTTGDSDIACGCVATDCSVLQHDNDVYEL